MRLTLRHHHRPPPSFTALLGKHLEFLRTALRIDETHILVEDRIEASPAIRVSARLVTPGPNVFAEVVDRALHAALQKMIAQLEASIDPHHFKRTCHTQSPFKSASPTQFAAKRLRN